MTRTELRRMGSTLGINCGGVGGTPGPCPLDGNEPGSSGLASKRAEEASDRANRLKLGRKAKELAHMRAFRAHSEAAGVAKASGDTDIESYHRARSNEHYKKALDQNVRNQSQSSRSGQRPR